MSVNLSFIRADRGIKYAVVLTGVVLLIETVVSIFLYTKFPPLIPLFNSLSWGRDRLAPSFFIFTIPAFILSIMIANIFFASVSYKKHALLSRMVSINLVLISALSLVALGQIFLLIF